MRNWRFFPAADQSDIIWEDFTKDSTISTTKTIILWVFLVILSVILVTPVLLIEYMTEIEEKFGLEYKLISQEAITEYISSLSAMIVSILLIPFLLDMMVLMEDFKTKSQR